MTSWRVVRSMSRMRAGLRRPLAVRSFVFNEVLALRIQQGLWGQTLPGDVMDPAGRPTGPLWGRGRVTTTDQAQALETAENDPKSLILVTADMAHSNPPMVSAFVAELARRLKGRGPALALPLTWIEQRLAESGLTIEQLVQSENQQQAADQVSISNSIGSLRVLGAMDWRQFVESMSVVEQTLFEDPDGVYGRMDFATRDRYRHATEALAKKGNLSEGEVARKAVELAHAAIGERHRHVGYFLIDKGLPALEAAWAR